MSDKNRKTAYSVLWDVGRNGAFSNLALNNHILREKPENPPFVRELVYGVLQNQFYLDWMIKPFLKQPIEKLGFAEKTLLRLGFWQILFSNAIPPFAAVNETVDLAKKVAKGREGFINAVLRNALREEDILSRAPLPDCEKDPVAYLSVRYSANEWIVRKWVEEYGRAEAEKMLSASLSTPPLSIRPNRTKNTKEELAEALRRENPSLRVEPGTKAENCLLVSGGAVTDLDAYREGRFSVQEETSILATEALSVQPGDTVYDVCAAPGGKTLAIAEVLNGTGTIVACDVNGAKLGRIRKEAKRLGLPIPRIVLRDAATGNAPQTQPIPVGASLVLLPESADRVLVDAPCSGLGILARKPEIKLRKADPEWEDLPEKQLSILQTSAALVKPGGTLVYSTCTVSRTENEGVVHAFLENNPEWICQSETQYMPAASEADGFYIARMVRKGTK